MEYEINKLFGVMKDFLAGYSKENWTSLQTNSSTAIFPNKTNYSFNKQYSSIAHEGEEVGGKYQPGNVLDMLLNKNDSSYFVSIFFGTKKQKIEYRLIKLTKQISEPLKEAFYELGSIECTDDTTVDQGELAFGGNYLETANKITAWLRFQIDDLEAK